MTDLNTAKMVTDLRETNAAVRANGWVAPGLGVPGAPLGLLSGMGTPLSGLAAAGLSWFTPLVSFLDEPLTQLRGGNPSSVMSGAQDFGAAGGDIAEVAGGYRASTSAQTADWSGEAATEYRSSGAVHADGVAGLGEASNTVASAIIGAAQVVAQAIAEITELIAQAVAQIVPILTQAVARAAETFGQSVVEAIPPCVGIAVEYALRIAAKLAALVASGDNLLKLVKGGMAVVELLQTAMDSISQQSVGAEARAAGGAGPASAAAVPETPTVGGNTASAGASGSGGGSSMSAPGGSGGGGSTLGGLPTSMDSTTNTSGAMPLTSTSLAGTSLSSTVPDASRSGGGMPAARGGGVPVGSAAAPRSAGGARAGGARGTASREDTQAVRTPGGGGGTSSGVPVGGAMGGGRPAGDQDREHQRKYPVVAGHEVELVAVPKVIG
ncbi:hypothetical protein [Actinophytocola sediminis]